MNENLGWISIHRQIQSHWIWRDANKFKWWVDILLTVNFSDAEVLIGMDTFPCKRGQSLLSLQSWARRWGVSKDTARNFIKLLVRNDMITHANLGKTTLITVCNYDTYQIPLHGEVENSTRKPNASPTQYNNDNKKNKNNMFFAPSYSDVEAYFLKNGFSKEAALQAHSYYERTNWKDSNNRQVKNWKLKMQGVWFKEENKIQPKQQRKLVL